MTLKIKIILASALVFGIILIGFALIVYRTTQGALLERLDLTLERFAARLQSEVDEPDSTSDAASLAELAKITPQGFNEVRFQLFRINGSIAVADTILGAIPPANLHDIMTSGSRAQTVTIAREEYRCLWIPLEINDRILYISEVATTTADVHAALGRLRLIMLIAIPSVLALAGLATFAITRAAFRPMTAMANSARQITAYNLQRELELPKAHDEVRLFGETFNELLRRLEAAFKSQKQFVADASHELRTPLTVLQSELEFAVGHPDNPAVGDSLISALTEIERLNKLTGSLLLLARLDAAQLRLDPMPVRLDELCLESIQMMKRNADAKQIRVDFSIHDPDEIIADGPKLKSAILNLIENAIKYSHAGSVVQICVKRQSDGISISVQDSGPGIAPSDMPQIFERFSRGKTSRPSTEGNGLGLAIARSLVELHGGTLTASSDHGKGSIFTICLPRN